MVRVMASGVFDILHLGHLHFLEEAKKLGDELIVVVATDKTAEKNKHLPITPEDMRVEMIRALRVVDKVVLGHHGDPYVIVEELKPDIIVLGFNQHHDDETMLNQLRNRGLQNVTIHRLPKFDHDLNGTRKIIRKILDEASRFRTLDNI